MIDIATTNEPGGKKGMAYITLPEVEAMPPRVQEQAKRILEKGRKLGETFKLLALREDIFCATDGMAKAYLLAKTELPFSTKERIGLLVSLENSCKMCVDIHKSVARKIGMTEEQINEVIDGVDNIQCDESEKTLLRFCVRASKKENYKILQSDVDDVKKSGYSDTQVIEAVAITAYFNYINTISNALGLE